MKISAFSLSDITLGKHNIKDSRLDQLEKSAQTAKKTYVQIEFIPEADALNADSILTLTDYRCDLILKDLEFIDTRLSRCENEQEKITLAKLKSSLEKEKFIYELGINDQEKNIISGYDLLTVKPVVVINKEELEDLNNLLFKILRESGFISFFTAVGGKEARAWSIKQGTTAWQAAGLVHSDIQKGFIRAEIISFNDFLQAGGLTQAKQSGKMRLEQKDYILQDADIVSFRFNK